MIIFFVIIIALEVYVFFGLNSLFSNYSFRQKLIFYSITSIVILSGITLLALQARHGFSEMSYTTTLIWGLAFSIILSRLFMFSGYLLEDIYRIIRWIVESLSHMNIASFVSRSKYYGGFFFVAGSVVMTALLYGVLFGKYNFKVHEHDLKFKNLPSQFNGFKIAHISDLHLGTFHDTEKVECGLKMLQEQNPDIIVFTGDMVNNRAIEAKKFIEAFKALKAPYGKYSILGNHDYGHYVKEQGFSHKKNLSDLEKYHAEMGFKLLKNENSKININGSEIIIAGVENWGKRPFPQYGNLDSTYADVSESGFNVLLSHDPTHWTEKVLSFRKNVDLTLSGHTHGMQFGIEMFGFSWSPVKYVYENWAGLYEKNGKKLYVNRGFGHIGYPGRFGIWPEITILNLYTINN